MHIRFILTFLILLCNTLIAQSNFTMPVSLSYSNFDNIRYFNGSYFCWSEKGILFTAADVQNWKRVNTPDNNGVLNVTLAGERHFILTADGSLHILNGTELTTCNAPGIGFTTGVVKYGNKFYAGAGELLAHSTDEINWSLDESLESGKFSSPISYINTAGNSLFISNKSATYTTKDGAIWETVKEYGNDPENPDSIGYTFGKMRNISYEDNLYKASALDSFKFSNGSGFISEDGVVWFEETPMRPLEGIIPATGAKVKITATNGTNGSSYPNIYTYLNDSLHVSIEGWSGDGLDLSYYPDKYRVAFGDSGFVLVNGTTPIWSNNPLDKEKIKNPVSPTLLSLTDVIWDGTRYVACGKGGLICWSTDGGSWERLPTECMVEDGWNNVPRIVYEKDYGYARVNGKYGSEYFQCNQQGEWTKDTLFTKNGTPRHSTDRVTFRSGVDGYAVYRNGESVPVASPVKIGIYDTRYITGGDSSLLVCGSPSLNSEIWVAVLIKENGDTARTVLGSQDEEFFGAPLWNGRNYVAYINGEKRVLSNLNKWNSEGAITGIDTSKNPFGLYKTYVNDLYYLAFEDTIYTSADGLSWIPKIAFANCKAMNKSIAISDSKWYSLVTGEIGELEFPEPIPEFSNVEYSLSEKRIFLAFRNNTIISSPIDTLAESTPVLKLDKVVFSAPKIFTIGKRLSVTLPLNVKSVELDIFTCSGKLVKRISLQNKSSRFVVDLSGLSSSVFLYQIKTGNIKTTGKISLIK